MLIIFLILLVNNLMLIFVYMILFKKSKKYSFHKYLKKELEDNEGENENVISIIYINLLE